MSKRKNRKGRRRRPSRNGSAHPTPKKSKCERTSTPKLFEGKGVPTPKQKKRNSRNSNFPAQAFDYSITDVDPDIPGPLTFVPPGWLDRKPSLPDAAEQPTVTQCAAARNRLMGWVADGLDAAQAFPRGFPA